jgi:hypothetical protein
MTYLKRSVLLFAIIVLVLWGCKDTAKERESELAAERAAAFPNELIQTQKVDHIDNPAHEPMVVQHPDGTLFVAGFGATPDTESQPQLWKSSNGGESWERVDVGTADDGARGNSDVDLAMGPDGTLYFISMGFDWKTFEGVRMAIGASQDLGASWTWTTLSEDRYDDRPWVKVAPDGTAHAIWNDGSGVCHAVSKDRGQTWEEWDRVHPAGGSSHLAIGPEGEVAVRITPLSASGHQYDKGLELIEVSTDGGRTWITHDAPGIRGPWDATFSDSTIVPRWVEPLAWDAGGMLYHLWSEGKKVFLGRSANQGATWTQWVVANESDTAFFPYLIARGSGELAATWFTGSGANFQSENLMVNVALIQAPRSEDGQPLVARAAPFQPETWSENKGEVIRDTAGEYVPMIFLGKTELGVVTAMRDLRGDRESGLTLHGDQQGFTWRKFTWK